MHISALRESRFLKRTDVNPPILVTIRQLTQENVAKEGAPEELRWCVHFVEVDKPLVLNSTNAQLIAQIVASEETDNWPNTKIVLYDDPNISYQGKLVGGVRVRAPRVKQPPKAAPAPAPKAPAPLPPADPGPPPIEPDPEDVPF